MVGVDQFCYCASFGLPTVVQRRSLELFITAGDAAFQVGNRLHRAAFPAPWVRWAVGEHARSPLRFGGGDQQRSLSPLAIDR